MKMRSARILAAAAFGVFLAFPAAAQYIGVLQSAETMDRGTFKLMAAPIEVFGKNGADDEFGLGVRAGYGFTDRFDAEAKLGFFENGTLVGADGEFWLLKGKEPDAGLDVSLGGGLHWMSGKKGVYDTMGFELTPLVSGHVNKSFELYGALDTSFESIKDAPPRVDDSFTRVHLVPGVEYRLSEQADLVGEVGLALNDNSSTYAGVGLAFYIR
jgi:hypothetical protein